MGSIDRPEPAAIVRAVGWTTGVEEGPAFLSHIQRF